MASSCSSSSKCWRYDVFLSFRGYDTRNTFTSHLYQALYNKGINTFIDDELERGEEICPALLRVIETSRISIVIFSENYGSSPYCLDELVKITECKESKGQVILPVFYRVDPSDVEKQKGPFGAFLRSHETYGSEREKLQEWKISLTQVAGLSGWHLDNGNEAKTIQSIVEKVVTVVHPTLLHVADYPVGLHSHIHDMNHILSIGSHDVRMVGIWGIGGIGKTTVAKAIYNSVANEFEGSCFLANVREMSKQNRVIELQEKLLSEILGDKKLSVGNRYSGMNVIRDRLCNKKVLIVIDDVDNVDQLKMLAGQPDWFGAGSRIIITSRDEHVLFTHGVETVHKVKELCPSDSLQLFSWNAFRGSQPTKDFVGLSNDFAKYAKGLPLALVLLGSFLYGRSILEWQSELDKLKRSPNKQISEILQTSYDGLEDNEKAVFLDIACFFRGMDKDYVMKILQACDFNPVIGVQVLTEKSLISIENNKLQMHDLLQEMGRQVVHQESPNMPGKRSRLWFHEDVFHVLTENTGTDVIEGILLNLHEPEEVFLSAKAFKKMKRLRILIIRNAVLTEGPINLPNELRWLEWPACPFSSMPPMFQPRKLVALNMQRSTISQLEGFKNYKYLKFMDFRNCEFLKEIPDFSSIPNLESLNLEGCSSLVEVHQSVGYLDKLQFLSLDCCSNLRRLPSIFKLKSLATLLLASCKKLEAFPDIVEEMPFLAKLCLSKTAIKMLPPSVNNITGLKVLTVTYCQNLASLPSSIYTFRNLERLLLEGCSRLGNFPVNRQNEVQSSSHISSSNPSTRLLPEGSSGNEMQSSSSSLRFPLLRLLDLRNCNLADANFLVEPNCFPMLKELDLSGNSLITLPAIFSALTNLKTLNVSECKRLEEIPELPPNIKRVEARNCELLERFSQSVREGEIPSKLRVVDFSNCHKLAANQGKFLRNSLFSKVSVKNCQFEMLLPGSEMPEEFRIFDRGSLNYRVSLHECERIKGLAFCTILCSEAGATVNISCEIFVDGQSMISCSRQFFSINSDHLWLCYHPFFYPGSLQPAERIYSVEFNISFEVLGAPKGSTLKSYAVQFAYKEDTMMNDGSSTQSISASIDLMRSFYNDDEMKLALNARKRHDKQQSSTTSSLSSSLQPIERLMKEVVEMQENLQNKFLEAIEKREQERTAREEAWTMKELDRIKRERELLVQERSIAAAKDAAVLAFLQKFSEQGISVQLPDNPIVPMKFPDNQTVPVPLSAPVQLPKNQAVPVENVVKTREDASTESLVNIGPSRWPKEEIEALISLRTELEFQYQENGPKGPLWEEISASMKKLGYDRSAKRCKEKWENISKYFKKVKESNKRRPGDSKTSPYFEQHDALYREKTMRVDGSG